MTETPKEPEQNPEESIDIDQLEGFRVDPNANKPAPGEKGKSRTDAVNEETPLLELIDPDTNKELPGMRFKSDIFDKYKKKKD